MLCSADGKYEVSYKPNVVVYQDGTIMWIPPAIYKSSCPIDVRYFPFDEQECTMKFGSWTFDKYQVNLDWYDGEERVNLLDYTYSGTWDIIDCPGKLGEGLSEKGSSAAHTSAVISFFFRIRRKTLFYTVNLIIPCVLISFLSVCVFYLPADAGEKMTMCISILLALVVFLLLVSKILPPTSLTIPLIAKYLLFTFVMNIVTILLTVIIINWNFRTPRTHRMPKWVRVVFLNYLPRILCMKRPNHSERWAKKNYSKLYSSGASPGGGSQLQQYRPQHEVQQFSVNTPRADIVELSNMSHSQRQQHHQQQLQSQYQHSTPSVTHRFNSARHNNHTSSPHVPSPSTSSRDVNSTSGDADAPFHMTPETHKAVEAVRFIAAHLRNEDDYSEVSAWPRFTKSNCTRKNNGRMLL